MTIYRALKDTEVQVVGGVVPVPAGQLVDFKNQKPSEDLFEEVEEAKEVAPRVRNRRKKV